MRKTVLNVLLVTLLMGRSGSALAQQFSPVDARLVIPDLKVLPGVPFDMWIDVRNRSDATVSVGLFPYLVARGERGDAFLIAPDRGSYPVLLAAPSSEGGNPISYLELAPGEQRTLTLPIREYLRGAEFFDDWRISPPGQYTFSIRLESFPPTFGKPPLSYLGPVVTSEASFERVQPHDTDARVWQRMQELGRGHWSPDCAAITKTLKHEVACNSKEGPHIWREVLTKYPESNYVPYALAATGGDLNQLSAAIARFPSSPVIEFLQTRVWSLTASACGLSGNSAALCNRASAAVHSSTRPTTRVRVFGREDVTKPTSPPEL